MKEAAISYYQEESRKLFDEWKNVSGSVEYKAKRDVKTLHIDHKNTVFIKDGVVCPDTWFSDDAHVRPLFLLKEAYGGKEDWDLIQDHLTKDQAISKIWKRISEWTKGLLETTADHTAPYVADEHAVSHFNNQYLQRIAVINIKKSDGNKTSNLDIIRAYATFDNDKLRKQLELCDPTIIICGYTGSVLDQIMGERVREPQNDNLFYHITLKGHDVLVLDYWHPANHYPDIMNYYGLMGIYQQALIAGTKEQFT